MRIGREAWVLIVMLALLAGLTTFVAERDYDDRSRSAPTGHSVAPNGIRALRDLLALRGHRPVFWERPARELPPGSMLILHEPISRSGTAEERADLTGWVERGGTCLLFVSLEGSQTETLRPEGLEVAGSARGLTSPFAHRDVNLAPIDSGSNARAEASHPLGRDLGVMPWTPGPVLRGEAVEAGRPVVRRDGEVVAAELPAGAGRWIVVSDGLSAHNGRIVSSDAAVLVLNAAELHAGGTVLFDEYHHGYGVEGGRARTLWSVIGPAWRGLCWVLLVLLVAWVVSLNARLGPPLVMCRPAPQTADYIRLMARLYAEARATSAAVGAAWLSFRHGAAGAVGVRDPDAPGAVATAAAQRLHEAPGAVRWAIERAEAIERGAATATEAEMVTILRGLAEARRRLGVGR